jgi:hypothetical protein
VDGKRYGWKWYKTDSSKNVHSLRVCSRDGNNVCDIIAGGIMMTTRIVIEGARQIGANEDG